MNKKNCIKNHRCYYFDDIVKIQDLDFDNILLDEKPYNNTLIYNISYETLIGGNLFFDSTNTAEI